jgi:hypothetical protein
MQIKKTVIGLAATAMVSGALAAAPAASLGVYHDIVHQGKPSAGVYHDIVVHDNADGKAKAFTSPDKGVYHDI